MPASISDFVRGEALLLVAVREQPERAAALDDRQHLEPAPLAQEVGDGRVARLVRRHRLAVGVRVDDRLLQADLLGELRLHHVVEVHLLAPVAERDEQRLVEAGARSSPACSRTSRARCARVRVSSSSCS